MEDVNAALKNKKERSKGLYNCIKQEVWTTKKEALDGVLHVIAWDRRLNILSVVCEEAKMK